MSTMKQLSSFSDFLSHWDDNITSEILFFARFQTIRAALPVPTIRLQNYTFHPSQFAINIFLGCVLDTLAEQIAAFICSYYPAYVVVVRAHTSTANHSIVLVYYVQYKNSEGEPALPIPPNECHLAYCTWVKRIENEAGVCPFRNLNKPDNLYMSEPVYSHCFLPSPFFSAIFLKLPDFLPVDIEHYRNLRWKLHARWILLAFGSSQHPLHAQFDILREIAGFL